MYKRTPLSIGRNVHFYDASRPDDALGGLIFKPSITKDNFLFMLEIIIVTSHPCSVSLRGTGVILLEPGHYDIRPNSPEDDISTLTDCLWQRFRSQVRARDGKCVITGRRNVEADRGIWRGFEVAHVFPVASEQLFIYDNGINSCQNGLLMQSTVHQMFDGLDFSINPDDNYKITCFGRDDWLDGRILQIRGNEVVANMRGAGEPNFEMDFPPGTDMMGEIFSGPEAMKRIVAELFSRLNGLS
ncbi:hypothetical protein V1506DRAFT_570678 [Lipomyces tetrasporus]